jgi:EmrB/QacA subfamily drug resistance transporter
MSANATTERAALTVATLTSFMNPFMISAVNVAMPAIQESFGADAVLLSWIATAYLLATAVALVPAGKIGDIYGRKRVFLVGLLVFTLSTFFSALALSIRMLIALRVLQGLGAAMTVTTGMAILTSVFPAQRRGRAIGIYVAAVYVGLSLGPAVGGLLTQQLGWRCIFLAGAPCGLVALFLTMHNLKGEWADARGEKLDLAGSILYGAALIGLVCGATRLPAPVAVVMVVAGAAGLAAFALWELNVPQPVFEVRLFRGNRLFAYSSLAALIHYSATFAVTFLLSLYLQYIEGLTPQEAGLVLIAQPVLMALCSPLAGRLSDRIEPRIIASAGMALTAVGLGVLLLLDFDTPVPAVVGILMLLGIGFALFSSPNMNAIMGSVDRRLYGIASGAVATMRLLGQMFSMAVATVVFSLLIGHNEIVAANLPLFLSSMRVCLSISVALCTVGIGFSLSRGGLRRR